MHVCVGRLKLEIHKKKYSNENNWIDSGCLETCLYGYIFFYF